MSYAVPFADIGAMTREVRTTICEGWANVLNTSRFIGGQECDRFEQSWAAYCGASHAIGVGNGTDALQLTLMALGIGPGDEVVVPTNTFVASAEAVVLAGATPRFADVSPETLLLTAESLDAAVNHRTRAVIVVHLYGRCRTWIRWAGPRNEPESRSSRTRLKHTARRGVVGGRAH